MQDNRTFYLFVKGQRVEVREEIYRAYVQPERKQRMREYRAKDNVSVTSIEQLSEKGFEIEDTSQDFVTDLIESETHAEELASLKAAIEKLSERDRRIIQMYYFEGKTQQEIAVILGIKQHFVSELLSRILLRLKKFL